MGEYLLLLLAIVCEKTATSLLKQSEGFTKLWPSVVIVVGYVASFYFLSLVLKSMPNQYSLCYLVCGGKIGRMVFKQTVDSTRNYRYGIYCSRGV